MAEVYWTYFKNDDGLHTHNVGHASFERAKRAWKADAEATGWRGTITWIQSPNGEWEGHGYRFPIFIKAGHY